MAAYDLTDAPAVTRRALLLAGGKLLLFGALAARLYHLQIREQAHYRTLAEENRINLQLVAPPRGRILDRNSMPLAENRQMFQAVLVAEPRERALTERTLRRLQELLALEDAQVDAVLREIRSTRPGNAVLVAENLGWDQLAALEYHKPELPSVMIETGQIRAYSFGPAFAHLLGYVGIPNAKDLEREPDAEPLLRLPGFRIGKGGVEQRADSRLRGTPGGLQREVDAHGQVVREIARAAPQPGADLTLTLDAGLQQMALTRLAQQESGAAVVMDAQSGALYALVSHPSFDPNDFALVVPAKIWNALRDDERVPLMNKALAGQYAPGSTIKMCSALAALDAGVCTPQTVVHCSGHYVLGGSRFHCWKRGGHGAVDLHKSITQSCDVYFYEMARRMGIDALAAMLRRFGLGAALGADIPGLRTGLVPDPVWKRTARKEPWQAGETLIAAIGQGAMLATPLQLAVMMARLVNGGLAVVPHIEATTKAASFARLGLRADYLALIKRAMDDTVMKPGGTAYGARILIDGLSMGGKTGTSQVRRITKAERARGIVPNDQRPWRERDHALFVGYGPVEAPRYVIALLVEHGGSGGAVAAPMARDILQECLQRNPAGA